MSKHRPDPDRLANELAGASAFFKRTAPERPVEPEPGQEPTGMAVSERRHDVTTSRIHDATGSAAAPPAGFDINRETSSHDTLRLATDETRALEELKSVLKWDFDVTVSKDDICRVALHELLEDFRAKGHASAAVKRLKKKLARR